MRTSAHHIDRDEELAARTSRGDRAAFEALYERHFDEIYDFAVRTVRDRDSASDVVQRAFAGAWEALTRGTDVKNVRAWLYAIARNAAMDELRLRKRTVPSALLAGDQGTSAGSDVAEPSTPDPPTVAIDREAAALVWTSAAALAPQEYALLDLHVRRGLSAEEIADSLGIRKGAVHTRLSRLRDSFEQSVTAALLVKRGRRECSDLDALLSRMRTTEITRAVRKAVQDHVRDCERCRESKRRFVSPIEILAGLVPIPAAPGLRDVLWSGIAQKTASAAGGRTPRARQQPWRRWAEGLLGSPGAAIALLIPILAAVITGGVVLGGGSGLDIEDPANVHSISHELGESSDNRIVTIVWTPRPEARGFSVDWTSGANDLPDDISDLPGSATGTRSPSLATGTWYFHLRTQGQNEEWTSTVHLGPFLIEPTPPDDRVASVRVGNDDERSSGRNDHPLDDPSGNSPLQEREAGSDDGGVPGGRGAGDGGTGDEGASGDPDESPPVDPPADTTPPVPPLLTSVPDDLTSDITPVWTFEGEPGATFECSLAIDAVVAFSPAPCTSPVTYDLGGSPDGTYTLIVNQTDTAGNVSIPATDSFVLDTTPPEPPIITSAPPDVTSNATPTWTFEGEPGAAFVCLLSGPGNVSSVTLECTSSATYDLTDSPDGVYTFSVTQTDAAGNVSPPATDSFTLMRFFPQPDPEPEPSPDPEPEPCPEFVASLVQTEQEPCRGSNDTE